MFWFKKGEVETDPVCNMKVVKEKAKYSEVYNGRTYYFCSADCKEQFTKEPKNFIA